MWGIVAGDIIGSRYRTTPATHRRFPLFAEKVRISECTTCGAAVAAALLDAKNAGLETPDYRAHLLAYRRKFPSRADAPGAGHGASADGASRRMPPSCAVAIAAAFDSADEVDAQADELWNAASGVLDVEDDLQRCLHIVALAAFRARRLGVGDPLPKVESVLSFPPNSGAAMRRMFLERNPYAHDPTNREREARFAVAREVEDRYDLDLGVGLADLRYGYEYSDSCTDVIRDALVCFLEARDFEDAVRNAVSLGGDSSILGALAGGVAAALYGVPMEVRSYARATVSDEVRVVLDEFEARFAPAERVRT